MTRPGGFRGVAVGLLLTGLLAGCGGSSGGASDTQGACKKIKADRTQLSSALTARSQTRVEDLLKTLRSDAAGGSADLQKAVNDFTTKVDTLFKQRTDPSAVSAQFQGLQTSAQRILTVCKGAGVQLGG